MGVPLPDVEGVTIGCRARDAADPDAAAGATNIFDHDGLAQRDPHSLGHDPRRSIGRSARRERNDQRNGSGWIGLRLRARDAGKDRQCQRRPKSSHDVPPRLLKTLTFLSVDLRRALQRRFQFFERKIRAARDLEDRCLTAAAELCGVRNLCRDFDRNHDRAMLVGMDRAIPAMPSIPACPPARSQGGP